ncbi:hypothetical protein NP233_g11926 [Leucocoprinus birnbaumii]|uniref:DUF6533 domain-containing protein n=1 Tax=Leucocoprinus birnbaumii TaxID=56174 RepID=A0AAD5VFE1_9AGAR|nr:hypothetical protein NP233_g11926 [Leucocoprinus birnbaumii]
MLDPSNAAEEYVQTITSVLPSLYIERYLSAFAVSVALWDHCITLNDEFEAVWVNREQNVLWHVAYLIFRYGTDAVMIFTAYSLSGTVDVGNGM